MICSDRKEKPMRCPAITVSLILAIQLLGCSQKAGKAEPNSSAAQADQTQVRADASQEPVYETPSSGIIGIQGASMRPSSNASAFMTYEKEDGTVDFVLRVESANWTEARGEEDSPLVVSDVVGMAGVGEDPDAARANLSTLKTKKDRNGSGIIYFDQATPFRGVDRFYIRRAMGRYELYPASLKAINSEAKMIDTKYDKKATD
jgi:hypothetical protein